jgi:hypothetical protein
MDCYFRQVGHFVYLLPTGLTMEFEKRKLLYRAVVARSALELQRPNRDAEFEYQNAGRDLEAGYFHLQRQKILPPHDNDAQQTTPHQQRRQHSLLGPVRSIKTNPKSIPIL